jgi:hypothetical protein
MVYSLSLIYTNFVNKLLVLRELLIVLSGDVIEDFLPRIVLSRRLFDLLVAMSEQREVLVRSLNRSIGKEGVKVQEVALRAREGTLVLPDHWVVPTDEVVPRRRDYIKWRVMQADFEAAADLSGVIIKGLAESTTLGLSSFTITAKVALAIKVLGLTNNSIEENTGSCDD